MPRQALNAKTQRYEERRSDLDGLSVPPLPAELWKLVEAAAETATEACASVPRIEPGACLINHYAHSGRLGMHQDRSERPETLRRGSPVVSISIGDSCDFEYSETRPEETDAAMAALGGNHRVKSVRLDSGDVLIFGGPRQDALPRREQGASQPPTQGPHAGARAAQPDLSRALEGVATGAAGSAGSYCRTAPCVSFSMVQLTQLFRGCVSRSSVDV